MSETTRNLPLEIFNSTRVR